MSFCRLSSLIRNKISGSLVLDTCYYYSTKPRFKQPWKASLLHLGRRIRHLKGPNASAVPLLDQWIQNGAPSVTEHQLLSLIRELRYCTRYAHALEISMWMSDKRYFTLTPRHVAIRLDLMSKVHGIEEVENYFNNIPQQLKGLEVYGALLNCYAYVRSVEKAEAVMQKMRDLGFAKTSGSYTVMLNLYYQTANFEKFETLMQEIDKTGIIYDRFTYALRLCSYAAVSNIEGMKMMQKRMESDPNVVLDWSTYAAVANAYIKSGLVDEALQMLKKSEGLIAGKRINAAYNFHITLYTKIGKKDEVLRVWEDYKKKFQNRAYANIITSLLTFDDLEKAEQLLEEWELLTPNYSFRIPNYLIGAYSSKGLFEKAETLINRGISKGGTPNASTWYSLAKGYLENDQTAMAVEAMEKAIAVSDLRWKPSNESLAACLGNLKEEGYLEKAEGFIKALVDKDIISLDIQDKLLNHIRDGTSNKDTLSVLTNNSLVGNSMTL